MTSDSSNLADGLVSPHIGALNEITVLFEDGTLTFPMPPAAILADLAQRLAEEGGRECRQMLSVTVKLGSAPDFNDQYRQREAL